MAKTRRGQPPEKDSRPVAVNDFIYEEPDDSSDSFHSDTPEEAIRKLRGRSAADDSSDTAASSAASPEEESSAPEIGKSAPNKRKIYSSGVVLDDNLQPVGRERRRHPFFRGLALTLVTLLLLFTAGSYILHRITGYSLLKAPENAVSAIVTPIQSFFSGITESVADYFRSMKLRNNIENEYNELRAINEQLVYKAMLADELQQTLSQYEDLSDEIKANANMRPIVATVIGRSDANYYSMMTINKGTADGVEDYMAVTISGALVGYTEETQEHKSTVRTIIDSNASIAALIQSSRDQGTVRGTLGVVDGPPMCRMYYLPDDNLPRPGDLVVTSGVGFSFPKGIPIGTVRESTRGMDANKQYIVLEPQVDFQHMEYVIVLRYKPQAAGVEGRENGRTSMEFVPLESARPSPVIPEIAASLFDSPTPEPENAVLQETPSPTPEPTETPSPTPAATPQPTPGETPLEYVVINLHSDPTPTPSPTPGPTATPYFTPDPNGMTFEEDD